MMLDDSLTKWLQSRDRLAAIGLLSLDLARPFLHDLGITCSDPARFQAPLREAINTWPVALIMIVPRPQDEAVITAATEKLTEMTSAEHARALETWIDSVFSARNDPTWCMYRSTMIAWHGHWRKTGEDSMSFAAAAIRDEFGRLRDISGIKERSAQAKASAREHGRSRWDSFLYELGLYMDDREIANSINDLFDAPRVHDPFEMIEDTIVQFRFEQFWEFLIRHAKPAELELVKSTTERKFSTSISGALPSPKELRMRFSWPEG